MKNNIVKRNIKNILKGLLVLGSVVLIALFPAIKLFH